MNRPALEAGRSIVLGSNALDLKPPVRNDTRQCDRCGLYPAVQHRVCGACLGREILRVGTREQHTAKIRAAYEHARGRQ